MENCIYNSKDTRKILGSISSTTLWRYVKNGKLHKPLKPTERSTFWKSEWLEEFISNCEVNTVTGGAS